MRLQETIAADEVTFEQNLSYLLLPHCNLEQLFFLVGIIAHVLSMSLRKNIDRIIAFVVCYKSCRAV